MDTENNVITQFAPAGRVAIECIQDEFRYFESHENECALLNAIPDIVLILNHTRQTVFANKALLDFLKLGSYQDIIGKRPGEILNCLHASSVEGGCGTSEFCSTCGAVRAILTSQGGIKDEQECRISLNSGDSLDLKVWATPYTVKDEQYSIFTIVDISNEKRRKVLEKIFFHDVLNTAGGIQGMTELLHEATASEINEFTDILTNLSVVLIDEIKAQREILQAENNELITEYESFDLQSTFDEVTSLYQNHAVARNKGIITDYPKSIIKINSDKRLIRRVIGNILKNALEATKEELSVSIGFKSKGDVVECYVRNPSVMPRDIQLQIFKRSFSTKGKDRGLGTYSIKLLTEKYLKGKVWFESDILNGTTFFISLPSFE